MIIRREHHKRLGNEVLKVGDDLVSSLINKVLIFGACGSLDGPACPAFCLQADELFDH